MHTRVRQRTAKLLLTIVLIGVGILMILPFLWMLSTSFKRPFEVFQYPMQWIPSSLRFDNYEKVWAGDLSFWRYYWNSIKVTATSVVGTVIISSAAAYGFSRIVFRGRDAIFFLYLATLMIPDQVTLIPRFIVFNYMGIYNTHWALILPGFFMVFGTFLLRQFYMGIPKDFTEAAFMEGAGHIRIWLRIVMPLAKPALVSLVILSFTQHWNDYLNPLVFLTDKQLYTIPVGLTNFIDEAGTEYSLMMAAAVSSIMPVIILFLFGQKWFIQGVASSGVKG
ncbi:carbohydrate ABC transporter permease [Paenibacillaceae bacterium WGS1546]|uniref:carbohydrate ABC transporter permease n=1 Tax=Cohnella sp. WGS1546 TaxID=3366810 RepID=UPI00372D16E4